MAAKPLPDAEFLRNILDYNPETGGFTWRQRNASMFKTRRAASVWNRRYPGTPAGIIYPRHGYLVITINNQHYLAHRLAWKMMTGNDPEFVDHINHDRADNRFENLRDVDFSGNASNRKRRVNNKSGVTGVYREGQTKLWRAVIQLNGADIKLGRFKSFSDAVAARKAAEIEMGFHPNHGT